MKYIELADSHKSPSSDILLMIWKFITKEISDEFEQWVYSSSELQISLTEASYYLLISTNYRNQDEVIRLRALCFDFASRLNLDCLCLTFPSNMVLNPFWESTSPLKSYIESFNRLLVIKNFSGKPPVFCSRWYHPAELCICHKCDQHYLMLFEESEGCDYYMIKLEKSSANIILTNTVWPNNCWPKQLSSWEELNKIRFVNWNHLYDLLNGKPECSENLMLNYKYNIDRY